ncbi:MAG: hypothetical protein J7502_06625 [Flavisolibacter sp.]|nr:hypothetical protein [Flavisolibacter sp.]
MFSAPLAKPVKAPAAKRRVAPPGVTAAGGRAEQSEPIKPLEFTEAAASTHEGLYSKSEALRQAQGDKPRATLMGSSIGGHRSYISKGAKVAELCKGGLACCRRSECR